MTQKTPSIVGKVSSIGVKVTGFDRNIQRFNCERGYNIYPFHDRRVAYADGMKIIQCVECGLAE